MKSVSALPFWAFLLLVGCHSSEAARPERTAVTDSAGPCDIRPLAKLSQSIAVATPETVKFLGDVNTTTSTFRIYYYDFVNPGSNHENFRLIVFDARCKYLGMYVTADDPVRIEGNKVIYDTQYPGNVVTFTGDKPPDHIWIDGDLPKFYPPPN